MVVMVVVEGERRWEGRSSMMGVAAKRTVLERDGGGGGDEGGSVLAGWGDVAPEDEGGGEVVGVVTGGASSASTVASVSLSATDAGGVGRPFSRDWMASFLAFPSSLFHFESA